MRSAIAIALFFLSSIALGNEPSRVWDFDLKTPGTYKVQVEHPADSGTPQTTKVSYAFQVGDEAQSRELALVAGRPYIPLIVDIPSPRMMRVSITGISQSSLQRTHVYVFDAATVPPGEYYDPKTDSVKEVQAIRALLNQSPDTIDLGRVKLTIDKMIDPTVDIDGTLRKLDDMVAKIRTLPEYGASSAEKLTAVQTYIYQSGSWNDYQPFHYDLNDPLGKKLSNQMLASYLASRKGNCVTMPLLFIILGQRLGADVTLSTAPSHFLIKFNAEKIGWINLEATSGATPARDVWIRGQFPSMTDQAVTSGIYLKPLSKKEAAAAIATLVANNYFRQEQYDKAMAVADLVLEYYPKAVDMMILKGSAFARINRQRFPQYATPTQMTASDMAYRQYLSQNNRLWFEKAEALGWREETKEQENQYLQRVNQAKQN